MKRIVRHVLGLSVVLLALLLGGPVARPAAGQQLCFDCWIYRSTNPRLFEQQANCCLSGEQCRFATETDAYLGAQRQSGCYIINIEGGYTCDEEPFWSCDAPGGGSGGGGGGGGGGGECQQGPGEWCPAACSSCTPRN